MQLQQALLEIAEIRERVASVQVFRGFRAQGAALSAGIAFLAAVLQSRWLPQPTEELPRYVLWWSNVAALSIAIQTLDLARRWVQDPSGREQSRTAGVLRALAPPLVTGALATLVLVRTAPELGWTLPAVWSLLFAQGVFASAPMLPRGTWAIGAYYVASGLVVLTWGRGDQSLAGWTMAATFGIGQLFAAIVLYFALERGERMTPVREDQHGSSF